MNNVRDYGATGDGVTIDTAAIQNAIDNCEKNGGGTVFFPPGVYLSGTLYLRDNICLEISHSATVLGSPNREDYNADDFCPQNKVHISENVSGAHLLVAVEVSNCSLRGGGRIDGNRAAFYGEHRKDRPDWFKLNDWRPAQMLFFCECSKVTIEDVELNNAPYWTCFLHGCENVVIRGVRIQNDYATPNGDGIDIDCCRQVVVSDCIINAGDDCITLRACPKTLKQARVCEYVAVTNCVLSTERCNAFRVGVGDGVIRNCSFSNCIIHHTRTGICIIGRYSAGTSGVKIENISFSNITMEVIRPVFVASDVHGTQDETSKMIRGIRFNNLYGTASHSSLIEGNTDCQIHDVSFRNVNFSYSGGEDIQFGDKLCYGEFAVKAAPAAFHLRNALKIDFDSVKVTWETSNPNWKYGIWAQNCPETSLHNCKLNKISNINNMILSETERPES